MSVFVSYIDDVDVRRYSWFVSRPYISVTQELDLKEIEKVDLSLNSCKILFFHFKSSILFREILTSIKPYFMWAQTSRVNSIDKVEFPNYLSNGILNKCNELKQQALELLKSGVHQDKVRGLLPLASTTQYIFGTDFRTWISFLKSLRRYLPEYYRIYGTRIEEELGIRDLDSYPYKEIFPNLVTSQDISQIQNSDNGLIRTRKGQISLSLRAQLVRHVNMTVVDDLWYQVSYNQISEVDTYGDTTTNVAIITNKDNWNKLLSARSCWLAHYEIWEPLIYDDISMSDNLVRIIPCRSDAKNCPFKADMKGRISGDDPGIVCPFWKPHQAKELVNRRIEKVSMSKISNLYLDALGGLE